MNKLDRELDREIVKMAKQAKSPAGKEYEERIDGILESLHEEEASAQKTKRIRFVHSKAAIAACALLAVVAVSVPAAARIDSLVKARMQDMSEEEVQKYEEANNQDKMTKEHDTEALRYSRPLSADEGERYEKLRDKYVQEGMFPEGEIQMVEKLEENQEISTVIYETYNREIFLPDSALTDEELLQMIDFCEKSAWTVSHSDEAQKINKAQRAFFADPNPNENDISEEEAIAKATAYLEGIYQVDAAAMDISVEFVDGDGLKTVETGEWLYGEYEVTFRDSEEKAYCIRVGRETGMLSDVNVWLDGKSCAGDLGKTTKLTEESIISNYDRVKSIISNAFGKEEEIAVSVCEYVEDKDGRVTCGFVDYKVGLADGRVYGIRYCIEDDFFGYLYLESQDGWNPALHIPREGFRVVPLD